MAKPKLVFMYVGGDADPETHYVTMPPHSNFELMIVGVKDYDQAVEVSKDLIAEGVGTIELCGGFGNIGTARVAEAVGDKANVGVVRFDKHPNIDCNSGDSVFK